jgi:hydrogenase maturation protease
MKDYNSIKYRLLILGAGNPLMKDDGIGVHIAHKLEKLEMPEGVKVLDVGTRGFVLVDLMREAPKVLLIDAVEMGQEPGTVKIFTCRDIMGDREKRGFSLHEIGLPQVLLLAELQGIAPEVVIVGVQPKDLGWGAGLSPEVQKAVPHIVERVLGEMKKGF